jgi:hypothetical protein
MMSPSWREISGSITVTGTSQNSDPYSEILVPCLAQGWLRFAHNDISWISLRSDEQSLTCKQGLLRF